MIHKQCKKCNSDNIIMIEYGYPSNEHYDGISEIRCEDCGARFGRWSGLEIPKGYEESRYGERGIVKIKN